MTRKGGELPGKLSTRIFSGLPARERPRRERSGFPSAGYFRWIIFAGSLSFDHPSDERSGGETHGECTRQGEHWMSLDALSCVLQEFFGSITALFCGAPHYSNTIIDGIGNRTRGA
jgi:hypothetical protein